MNSIYNLSFFFQISISYTGDHLDLRKVNDSSLVIEVEVTPPAPIDSSHSTQPVNFRVIFTNTKLTGINGLGSRKIHLKTVDQC